MSEALQQSDTYFFDNFAHYGDRKAVVYIDNNALQSFSYASLDERLGALNEQLALAQKTLVLILCRNDLSTLAAYLFCLKYRHAAILVDDTIDEAWCEELIQRYQPTLVFGRGDSTLTLDSYTAIAFYVTEFGNSRRLKPLNDELAILLSTSGSTGSPKQVRLSFKNIDANAKSICGYLPISQHDRTITSLPFAYSYGLSVINSHLSMGSCVVLSNDSIVSKPFWDLFKTAEVSSLAGVPFQYETLKKMRFERMDLPSLRYMTQAGGKLDLAHQQYFKNLLSQAGKTFFVMYGQTEATARMAYLPVSSVLSEGCIGNAIPGGRFELWNEHEVPIDRVETVGELVYFGPNVMMGYAHDRDDLSTDADLPYLKTGDLAKCDESGFYYIVGRANRSVKLLGKRIDLDELASRIEEQNISSLVTFLNNKIYVCVINVDIDNETFMESGEVSNIEKILEDLFVEKLRLGATSYELVYLNEVPRTPNGKVSYSKLNSIILNKSG